MIGRLGQQLGGIFGGDQGKRRREAAELVTLLLLLELAAFRGYLLGWTTPSWDFLGPYGPQVYGWWNTGSFFHPTEWVSSVWNGYPAAASIQNSAWYLPVGLANWISPYTPHVAAVVSAVHVAFGALGAYVLCRKLGQRHLPALLVASAYFFGPGFFNGAAHVDILRGWAWLPWLLMLASPLWPWARWWALPLGAVCLWQIMMGVYPGVIAAAVYSVGAWTLTWLIQLSTSKARRRLVGSLLATGAIAALLAAVKFIPTLFLQTGPGTPDLMRFDLAKLASVFLPYGDLDAAGDRSMVSFFIPATCLLVAVGVPWARHVRPVVALLVTTAVLGLPFLPTYSWAHHLPLLGLSRFHMNDFKPFLVLGVLLLAGWGADRLWYTQTRMVRRLTVASVAIMAAGVALGATLRPDGWLVAIGIMAAGVASVLVTAYPHVARAGGVLRRLTILTTVTAGLFMAYATPAPWNVARHHDEVLAYGAPVSELIDRSRLAGDQSPRPARFLPGQDLAVAQRSTLGLTGYYTGRYAVAGYFNFKRNPVANQQLAAMAAQPDVLKFYRAPQTAVPVVFGALAPVTYGCLRQGTCGGIQAKALTYSPGRLTYGLLQPAQGLVAFNESYYPGWTAAVCNAHGCISEPVERGPAQAIAVPIPRGVWRVELTYVAPGQGLGWLGFWSGVLLILAWSGTRVFLYYAGGGKATVYSRST